MFSQRILVAFDTGRGLVYAQAEGWHRIYLRWTFRNFRSLPQNVLNPRQRELIASLYRGPHVYLGRGLDESAVIGTVEEFNPSSLPPAPVTVAADHSVPIPSPSQPWYGQVALNRMTLRVGAGALVAIMAVLAWHQLRATPISASWMEERAAIPQLANENSATTKDVSFEPAAPQASANAEAPPTAPMTSTIVAAAEPLPTISASAASAGQAANPARAAKQRGLSNLVAGAHAVVADAHDVADALPRMQISGRPEKLVYPVCPETTARGKVSLRAVVAYDGAVRQVRVLTGNRVLAAAAIEAVRQWRYQPFSADSQMSESQRLERETNITVSFISSEVVAVSFPNSAPLSRRAQIVSWSSAACG